MTPSATNVHDEVVFVNEKAPHAGLFVASLSL